MTDTRRAFQKLADALRATKLADAQTMPGRERQRVHPLEPLDVDTSTDIAAQVVAAAARYRSPTGFDAPAPEKDSAAELILQSGRRRRGEIA